MLTLRARLSLISPIDSWAPITVLISPKIAFLPIYISSMIRASIVKIMGSPTIISLVISPMPILPIRTIKRWALTLPMCCFF